MPSPALGRGIESALKRPGPDSVNRETKEKPYDL
jgi:hypothetical protein